MRLSEVLIVSAGLYEIGHGLSGWRLGGRCFFYVAVVAVISSNRHESGIRPPSPYRHRQSTRLRRALSRQGSRQGSQIPFRKGYRRTLSSVSFRVTEGAVMREVSKGISSRIMTYAEIEEAFSLKPASARQLVRRQGWRRLPGNDGRSRIEIPIEEFERALKRGVETPLHESETDAEPPVESPLERTFVAFLTAHIERLEQALTEAQLALSQAVADRSAETAKSDHLVGEVAALARQLAQVVEESGGRERELQARLALANAEAAQSRIDLIALEKRAEAETAQARAELEAWKARPWWRRLAS